VGPPPTLNISCSCPPAHAHLQCSLCYTASPPPESPPTTLHMAVGVVRPAKSSLFTTDSSLPLLPAGNDMSFHPPDHSPDAATPMPDATLTQPPVSHLEFRNTLAGQDQHSHSPSPSHLLSSKKRRTSRSKAPGELRRSTSTPHMRNMALGVSGDLSPTSSKARNKLGYHRTSVACGKPPSSYPSPPSHH
jgi:hypothetical protein